jgi:D-3-phosphoglycerate dehydrogenase
LDELFRCSDIISLHIPSTEETAKLINEELLSEMKTSSVIINTARGQVIDYLALSQMLISGRIAGAAIDIYETEPPIPENHPLLSAPNTILLPHIAYATKEAMLKRFEIAKSNIEFFLNGKVQNRIL